MSSSSVGFAYWIERCMMMICFLSRVSSLSPQHSRCYSGSSRLILRRGSDQPPTVIKMEPPRAGAMGPCWLTRCCIATGLLVRKMWRSSWAPEAICKSTVVVWRPSYAPIRKYKYVCLPRPAYRPQQTAAQGLMKETIARRGLRLKELFARVSGSKLELWVHNCSRQPLFGKLRCWVGGPRTPGLESLRAWR
jgi:hypothetical protein